MNRDYLFYHPVHHPLIEHKINLMRRYDVRMSKFCDLIREIGMYWGFKFTEHLILEPRIIGLFPDGDNKIEVSQIIHKKIEPD